MFKTIREDIQAIFAKDPSARSLAEVICCYPGLHALWFHRLAHFLWRHKRRFLARFLSHSNRFLTGIEIHPGAEIGRRFFIDHGAGVVIGETAEIGDDVLMYQGVVLGGTTPEKKKRHPTICNKAVIGIGAVLLGAITVGDDARVGSGSVVIRSVPPGTAVVGVPGRTAEDHREPPAELEHANLPDPIAEATRLILGEQAKLKERLRKLEASHGIAAQKDELVERRQEIEREFSQS